MFSILRLSFILCLLVFASLCTQAQISTNSQKQSPYDSLYAKAYSLGNTQPDSAIHYARQASRATQKTEEQAKAHWLIGFYARKQGYYGLAIQHYRKAYALYAAPKQKAMVLKNIALCYKNVGNHQEAIPIVFKAVQNFKALNDTSNLSRALQLLADCYRIQRSYYAADTCFRQALDICIKQKNKARVASIYDDLAFFKKQEMRHDSAAYYQRLALATFQEPNTTKQMMRLSRLAWYYMRSTRPDSAQHYLRQAQAIKTRNPKALIYLYATEGFMQFVAHHDSTARRTYQRCDSLLQLLSESSPSPAQQKFVAKLNYEIYHSGYQALGMLWSETERQKYSHVRAWFKEKMLPQKMLYDEISLRVVLTDSLVIERAKPKIEVITKIAPWWWALMAGVLAVGGLLLYWARTQEAKAREKEAQAKTEQMQAQTDFVEIIKASDVEGFDRIKPQEANLLQEAAQRLRRKLKPNETKLLVMSVRNYTYKQIGEALDISKDAAKMRAQRLKENLEVKSFKELI